MWRYGVGGVLAVGVLMAAGCSATGGDVTAERAKLAAYAAKTEYPRTAGVSRDLSAGAIIDGDRIRVVNFSSRRLEDVNIWINGGYVHHEASLPANGILNLPRSLFYNGSGVTLESQNVTITKVEVESGNTLYELWGPIRE